MAETEGALNVSRIIDETLDALYGYTRHQEQVTALTASVSLTQTAFTVAEGAQISRGLIEIGDEQMLVKSCDAIGNVTLQPYGRGVGNTSAVTHSPNDKVVMSPLYPRRRVRDIVFSTLREVFPSVYGVATQLYDISIVRTNYPLPADCYDVLAVEWHLPGPSRMWTPLRRWRVNRPAGDPEVEILGAVFPGQNRVRVTYIKDLPASLVTDDISSLGYSQDIHDILVLGSTARLLMFTEPARLQVQSVASHGRAEVVPAGTIKAAAQDVYSLFQRRVQQEADRLLQRYASIPHFNR